jgi:aspartyl-tRNA(Asn)/glutamyl-tRNA(Gln) amidotransferase subunit C
VKLANASRGAAQIDADLAAGLLVPCVQCIPWFHSLVAPNPLPLLCFGRLWGTKHPDMGDKNIIIDDVRHVAKLARLHLTANELEKFTGQLGSILGYVNKISQLDVKDVPPMAHALPLHNVLRDDVVEPSLTVDQALQNAPERDGDFFAVPKIIGGDEDSAG